MKYGDGGFKRNVYDYDDSLNITENDQSKFRELIREGYKPYSSWFESMCQKLKFDRRKISQELESAFLGSGSVPTFVLVLSLAVLVLDNSNMLRC